jgi:hypothetical protein
VDRDLGRSREYVANGAHQLPELRVPEVAVLSLEVRPALDDAECVGSLDILTDLVALTAFLGTRLGSVHPAELQPPIRCSGTIETRTSWMTMFLLPLDPDR